ncbi:sphingosine N-acyltransferase subunit lip1 [Turnera subulata]|uniref:Sphingosine N-acyltransferase subunit lip1 n=1 Tax=Turnera subulata TaxID=218843 RepID=A0A9Q0J3E6_9ROSI|nr:sphingosine N-acyltransferase subunit lip1 [Turnera subulata]
MFWKERERESKDNLIGGPPCGQVRVLVVGDSGVGKSSLVHLIEKGSSISRPPQTIGCTVGVKHIIYGNSGSSSSSIKGDAERDFFVELWDVSGHDRYKDCRSLFYSQINVTILRQICLVCMGVIFVHDLSQKRTKASLQKWASEIAETGTFSAPLGSGGPGGLPVPYIIIGNKDDLSTREETGSSGNLVDAARQWVEKQGLLPTSEELPLTETFPGSGGLKSVSITCSISFTYKNCEVWPGSLANDFIFSLFSIGRVEYLLEFIVDVFLCNTLFDNDGQAAKEARYDKEAVVKFFRMLIRRRYFSDELPAANSWSVSPVQKSIKHADETLSDDDPFYRSTSSNGDPYKYNKLPPLPAQRNLTPPPTLYPQQPVSVSASYSFPRFPLSGSQEINSTGRSKRSDINV